MPEEHRGGLSRRSDRVLLNNIRKELAIELGRPLDYRDQARIDAILAEHGTHFHTHVGEITEHYEASARSRGIGHVLRDRKRTQDGNTGE